MTEHDANEYFGDKHRLEQIQSQQDLLELQISTGSLYALDECKSIKRMRSTWILAPIAAVLLLSSKRGPLENSEMLFFSAGLLK